MIEASPAESQCTYRCVVLPDVMLATYEFVCMSQCTYRCVVLPDPGGASLPV